MNPATITKSRFLRAIAFSFIFIVLFLYLYQSPTKLESELRSVSAPVVGTDISLDKNGDTEVTPVDDANENEAQNVVVSRQREVNAALRAAVSSSPTLEPTMAPTSGSPTMNPKTAQPTLTPSVAKNDEAEDTDVDDDDDDDADNVIEESTEAGLSSTAAQTKGKGRNGGKRPQSEVTSNVDYSFESYNFAPESAMHKFHINFTELPENISTAEHMMVRLAPLNITMDRLLQCNAKRKNIPGPRFNRSCENRLAPSSIYPTFLDSPRRNPHHSKYRGRNVTTLEDTNWGGTCNKMEILAGAVWRMNNNYNETDRNALALGPIFSEVAWELDLELLSRDFPVLLDCQPCNGRLAAAKIILCGSLVVDGVVTDIRQDGYYQITHTYYAVDVYWNNGPSAMGFQFALAFALLPDQHLRRSVEYAMKNVLKSKTIGIHRRGMDNQCYEWIATGRGEYECHRDGKAYAQIDELSEIQVHDKLRQNFSFTTIENNHPLLMTCNYTLSDSQQQILRREWPSVFIEKKKMRKMNLFLSTDGMDPLGDNVLGRSSAFKKVVRINDLTPDANCSSSRHRNMLYDMWGLTLSDYHMGNPLSSCDAIVVHWRRILKKPTNSSFPPLCFNGFYEQPLSLKRRL